MICITGQYLGQDAEDTIEQIANLQKEPVDTPKESSVETKMPEQVSFGEFVTVMWKMKKAHPIDRVMQEEVSRMTNSFMQNSDIVDLKIK